MMQGKQAKIVSPIQERAILGYLATTRYPARDQVMFLLSMKAGLRAKEMAALTWAMVTDAQGQVAEVLHVPNRASKGKTGGRTIPLHPDLQAALVTLQTALARHHPLRHRLRLPHHRRREQQQHDDDEHDGDSDDDPVQEIAVCGAVQA